MIIVISRICSSIPKPVMREKIRAMTDLLEERFQRKMVSHRAGRWGLNATYARLLVEAGYRVDCSVTPHISWQIYPGDPRGSGGPDFTAFPDQPYFLDLEHLDRPGDSPLLEVPLSVVRTPYAGLNDWLEHGPSLLRRPLAGSSPPYHWLVPRDRLGEPSRHVGAIGSCLEKRLAVRRVGHAFFRTDARRQPVSSR